MIAYLFTAITATAERIFEHKLPCLTQSLGIVTPLTAKRTSLKENGGADTRTVVQSHFLYIKDYARHTEYACLAITWF